MPTMDAATKTTLRAAINACRDLVLSAGQGVVVLSGGGIRELEKPLSDLSFAGMYPSMGKVEPSARAVEKVLAAALEKTAAGAPRRAAIEHAKSLIDQVLSTFAAPVAA